MSHVIGHPRVSNMVFLSVAAHGEQQRMHVEIPPVGLDASLPTLSE